MQKQESILEIDRPKTLWNFEIQTDHAQKKKKKQKRTCRIVGFAVPADPSVKGKESEKRDK